MVEVIALSFFVCAGLEGERGIRVQRWVAGGWGECGLPRLPRATLPALRGRTLLAVYWAFLRRRCLLW